MSKDKEKEECIFIDGDKERIALVISNVLDNAARFVKEGTITISVDTNNTRLTRETRYNTFQ